MTSPALPDAVSLRPAGGEDINAVMAVEVRVHAAPWTSAHFFDEWGKPYSTTWVLTDDATDTQLLGYVVFREMETWLEILNLAVDLPFQGHGYGKFIMQHVKRRALQSSATRLLLDVRKTNLAAIHLYQSEGFLITQLRKGFYSNGEDAYQMELSIEPAERGS